MTKKFDEYQELMLSDALGKRLQQYGIQSVPCGVYCGQGWYPLIEKLVQDLIALGWDKDLQQVKEKFGSLRFYIGAGTAEMYALVKQAETLSATTCEACGKPGKIQGGLWLKCLCPEHAEVHL